MPALETASHPALETAYNPALESAFVSAFVSAFELAGRLGAWLTWDTWPAREIFRRLGTWLA